MEEEGAAMSCTKKRRFEFDFDKCLEDSADENPPEIVVVKTGGFTDGDRSLLAQREQPPCAALMDDVRRLSDQELEDKIRRLSAKLNEVFCSKLPDKGEKLKANIRRHQEERERRRLQNDVKGANECMGNEHTERSKPGGASVEASQEAPLSQAPSHSKFSPQFAQKLETDKASCIHVSDNEHVVSEAFDKDLQASGCVDRRKRKQKAQFTHKRKGKNIPSRNGREKAQLRSSKRLIAHRSNLAENDGRDACEGLHSDKSRSEKTVVLLDEEEPDLGDIAPTVEEAGLRGTTIYYPSREDPECVEIHYKDLECLAPGEYLTSTIMNFYIRFLQGPSSAAENAGNDYHFFNTYFYKKLQEAVSRQNSDKKASFVKLRRWWRGVNIFQKAYMFLPIHEDLHWSLAVVCFPDKKDDSGPIILHLDSLRYHLSRSIFHKVRRFLIEEWHYLKEANDPPDVPFTNRIWEHLPRRIEEKIITVPQQNNDSDCGLFVLYFMERFLRGASQRLRKQNLGMFGKCWFKPEEASDLRRKIKLRLTEEFYKQTRRFEPLNLPSSGDSIDKPGGAT